MKNYLLLFLKGMAMGAADVVPGVSGGTIAFITGIYDTLIDSIRSVDGKAIRLLLKADFKGFWEHINGTFLVVLLSGIAASVLILSRLILFLLSNYPVLVWSFFFGLIIASVVLVARQIEKHTALSILAGLAGAVGAYLITSAGQAETPETYLFVFLSGAIAICAMILPGISGSFLLVLMSKYEFVLGALTNMKLDIIVAFASGCLVGILSFSHLLNYLLKNFRDITVSLLTGFMIGALNKVWPWKKTLETYVDRHGEVKDLVTANVFPAEYESVTGLPAMTLFCVLLMLAGFAFVLILDHFGSKNAAKS